MFDSVAVTASSLTSDIEIVVVDVDYGVAVVRPTLSDNSKSANHSISLRWDMYLGVSPMSRLLTSDLRESKRDLLPLISLSYFFHWLDN